MTDDKKRKLKRKLHNELAKQLRSRIISELESLSTDKLQLIVTENVEGLRLLIASRILKERSPKQAAECGPKKAPDKEAIPKKARKKKGRINERIFMRASPLYVASLEEDELPSRATRAISNS